MNSKRPRFRFWTLLGVLTLALGMTGRTAPVTLVSPIPPLPPTIDNPQIPADVRIPQSFNGFPIVFFDDYSWKAFLAVTWSAQTGHRGVPDTTKTVGDTAGPRVFETYKADWEVFHHDGSPPDPWETYGAPPQPGVGDMKFGDLALLFSSKFANLAQAGFLGTLAGPLVAQNRTYVRYQTYFNQTEYNTIVGRKLFLQDNLGLPFAPFPSTSMDLKASWMDMKDVPHPERYYTRTAYVFDLNTNTSSPITVGLVGLHIVQKTASRPQWIWSSFEHIDNSPLAGTGPPPPGSGPFAFNDGKGTHMPSNNPLSFPAPAMPDKPFNVERLIDIHPSTQSTNQVYQAALKAKGSIWQNYRLVMTQWPISNPPSSPVDPKTPGTKGNTFPGVGGEQSCFANTTMETFDQERLIGSCMSCHNSSPSDFVWSFKVNAFAPQRNINTDATLRNLKNVLQSIHTQNETQ